MKTRTIRHVVLGIVTALLMMPSVSMAGGGKGCSMLGTWFGVTSPEDTTLTGWMVTVTGKSNNRGTNDLEYPTFDFTLGNNFPTAVRGSSMRGNWVRTGGRTFDYTFMGMAVDADGVPVWIGKVVGTATISRDCMSERITALMKVYLPTDSPFEDEPLFVMPLPDHYGYRAGVDAP